MSTSIVVGQTISTTSGNRYPPNSSKSYYNFRLSVKLNSQSVETNTSNITVTLAICASFKGEAWSGGTAPTFKTQKSDNGGDWTDIASTSWGSFTSGSAGTYYNILSNTYNVQHNNDGTAQFSLRYVTTHGTNGWAPPATDGSIIDLIPPNIPRNPLIYFKMYDEEQEPEEATWRRANAFVKVGNVWKKAKNIFVKVGGTWKKTTRMGNTVN